MRGVMRHWLVSSGGCAVALLWGWLLSASEAASAADFPVSGQACLQDFPLVLSASHVPQLSFDAPHAMMVIDRQVQALDDRGLYLPCFKDADQQLDGPGGHP